MFWIIIMVIILFLDMEASWETKKHKYSITVNSIVTCFIDNKDSWIQIIWDDKNKSEYEQK